MSQPRPPLATVQIDRTASRVPHLLIADDRVIELRLLLEMIQQTGYRISVAFDGEKAYQRAQALQPDLILLDVQMPGLNGINACRLIRNNPATRHIPIIFLSAAHELHDRLEGLGSGAVDYITKPYAPEEVIARIGVHLRHLTTKKPDPAPQESTDYFISQHDQALVNATCDYLRERLATPLSTAQLAKLFRTNEKRLSRAFRDLLGYTVSEFVRRERLNQAERMLRTTGLTITQISEELGYSSSANFATAFKSQFGLTPTELRNVNQNQ